MTEMPENLRTFVEQTLSDARRQLVNRGQIEAVLGLMLPGGKIAGFQMPGEANRILNVKEAKRVLFGGLRHAAQELKAEAVIIVTDTWMGEPTAKQKLMSPEQLQALARSNRSLDDYVREGLVTKHEALMAMVQTPEDVFAIRQFYEHEPGGGIVFTKRMVDHTKQSDLLGANKMFGFRRNDDEEKVN